MNLLKKIPDNARTSLILLVVGILAFAAFILPRRLEQSRLNTFGAPLFEHALPADSYRVQTSAVKDDQGGVTAAVLLGTSMTAEELEEFYSDVECAPVGEGHTVDLSVKPLDEGSLSALRSAGQYMEGKEYFFVYLYSRQE